MTQQSIPTKVIYQILAIFTTCSMALGGIVWHVGSMILGAYMNHDNRITILEARVCSCDCTSPKHTDIPGQHENYIRLMACLPIEEKNKDDETNLSATSNTLHMPR